MYSKMQSYYDFIHKNNDYFNTKSFFQKVKMLGRANGLKNIA